MTLMSKFHDFEAENLFHFSQTYTVKRKKEATFLALILEYLCHMTVIGSNISFMNAKINSNSNNDNSRF